MDDLKGIAVFTVIIFAFVGLAHELDMDPTTLIEIFIGVGLAIYCIYVLTHFQSPPKKGK
jgi:hypothetical protein